MSCPLTLESARIVAAIAATFYIVCAFIPVVSVEGNISQNRKMAIVVFSIFQLGKIYVSIAIGLPGRSGVTLIDVYSILECFVIWFTILAEILYAAFHRYEVRYVITKIVALCASELLFIAITDAI